MLAGDVAKALGIGVQTLHYYEREGLIPAPARSESGYRLYSPELVERVRFVRKAQGLGLPLREVKDVLRLADRGSSPCGRVQAALAQKLREVDERLRELESFRIELATLIQAAASDRHSYGTPLVCGIVEEAPPLNAMHRDMKAKMRSPIPACSSSCDSSRPSRGREPRDDGPRRSC